MGRRCGVTAAVPLPLTWARQLIDNAAGAEIPEYGSVEFHELPEGPVKVASVILSAEERRLEREAVRRGALLPMSSRRAREIAEARRPRPEDHPGGPVRWIEAEAQ
jgi:hypothetical protein